MSLSYQTSALHLMSKMDTSGMKVVPAGEESWITRLTAARLSFGAPIQYNGSLKFVSPSLSAVVEWRNNLADKYRAHLGENLTWDEVSSFTFCLPVSSSADMLLRYVAAIFDQRGPEAASGLHGTPRPPRSDLDKVFALAEERKFSGRFPQLLLGPSIWLPFQRHLIIEEPDWLGNMTRFGSTIQLAAEVQDIRAFIEETDGQIASKAAGSANGANDVVAAAWQASTDIGRVCEASVAQHLPLWII